MRFINLPISKKLAIGFGAIVAVVAISSGFTVVQVRNVAEIEHINSVSDDAEDRIDQIVGDVSAVRAGTHKLAMTGQVSDKAVIEASIAELRNDFTAGKDILSKDGAQFLPDLADYQAKAESYLQARITPEMTLSLDPATRPQAVAMVVSGDSAPYIAATDSAFKKLHDEISAWSLDYTESGYRAMDQILTMVAGSGLLCIILGIVMAWVITRAIGGPLGTMTDTMRKLAAGDNTVAVPALDQTDEVGKMAQTVQVFKQAAIEKVRLEQEAVEARRVADEDRSRNEAARAAGAAQQAHVVQSVATGLERLSDGDLVFRLNDPFASDYEKLRGDFNGAMQKLQDTMVVVATNTSAIRAGANEITTASDDLSRRTEQQAASLEETAAALDQITATVKKTSEGSIHARKVVAGAKSDAEHSGEVVRQAVTAMSAIEKSSQQVSQIIGVIDEIAFQTNLLALNAGVEAARAGDAGRGFAVVASEVRGLAQRSAEAAKEIKALISASSQQVNEGVGLVGETGKALDRIVAQVADINGIVSDIAVSTQEQAVALQQVNTAVNQMDQVTQQNAAMVEESTAASHSLARETEELAVLIGRFELGREVGADTSRRPAARSSAPARKPVARAAQKPVAAMRTVGSGGATRKAEADAEGWAEF